MPYLVLTLVLWALRFHVQLPQRLSLQSSSSSSLLSSQKSSMHLLLALV